MRTDVHLRTSFEPQSAGDLPDGLVVFDAECVLCSAWVNFILPRDPGGRFRFASIQGATGELVASRLGIDSSAPATNVVIIDAVAYFKSDAALAVLSRLPGWRWTQLLKIFPRFMREWTYDRVARNRYALFGRAQRCIVPSPEHAARFLDRVVP